MAGIKYIEKIVHVEGCRESKEIKIPTNLPQIYATIINTPCYIVKNENGEIVALIDKNNLYVSALAQPRDIVSLIENIYYTVDGIEPIEELEKKIIKITKFIDTVFKATKIQFLLSEDDKKKLIEKIEKAIEEAKADDIEPVEVTVQF